MRDTADSAAAEEMIAAQTSAQAGLRVVDGTAQGRIISDPAFVSGADRDEMSSPFDTTAPDT